MTAPIRRGTAKRLGLDLPPADVVVHINPGLAAWAREFAKCMLAAQASLEADEAAVRASLQRFMANAFPTFPGLCGNRSPQLFGQTPLTCTLRAGHEGMHQEHDGTSWGVPS